MTEYAILGNSRYSLIIGNIQIWDDEYKRGNPYNTTFYVSITSDGFAGSGEFETDIASFIRFTKELHTLYKNVSGTAVLEDYCYGSKVEIICNATGKIIVKGVIYGCAMNQSIKFEFETDQTVLKEFNEKLYNDFAHRTEYSIPAPNIFQPEKKKYSLKSWLFGK